MATPNRCSMCRNSKRSGTCLCAGCKAYFCRKHFTDHHAGLLNELNVYIEEHNVLQELFNNSDYYEDTRSDIISQIDEWQRIMIEKVMQVAEQTRQQVKLSSPRRTDVTTRFKKFSERLTHLKQTEDLVEDDLRQLKDTIFELKHEMNQMNEPSSVELYVEQDDQIQWDRLISVKRKSITNKNKQHQLAATGKNMLVSWSYLVSGNKRWACASALEDQIHMSPKNKPRDITRVLIMGAGPTGLLMGCLMRDQGVAVTIVEKREEMTRTRCVKLMGEVLSSDYAAGGINLFSETQIEERHKAIESMSPKLFQKLTSWLGICTPLQNIQKALQEYFTTSGGQIVVGAQYDISKNIDSLRHYPDTLIVDCTGYHSVLRNHIQPDNMNGQLIEYVLICTFTFDDRYECNELCKYYKNRNTRKYQVIPSIDDTYKIGKRQTLVTCLITIDETLFKEMPKKESITYNYLKKSHRDIYDDLNIFLNNLSFGQLAKIHFDTMEFVALPLQMYRARKTTFSVSDNDLNQHWILLGDAAMGGPYFQSISMGYEAAIYLAYLIENIDSNVELLMTKYESYMEKLWLALQIRSKDIQRNKQILQHMCADDRNAILENIKEFKPSVLSIAGEEDTINKYRTSSTAIIQRHQTPIVQCIERRFAQFQGGVDVDCIEPLQVVKYANDQQVAPHYDWTPLLKDKVGGQRVTSYFIYLQANCSMGETEFLAIRFNSSLHERFCDILFCDEKSTERGIRFRPIPGNAIFFYNMDEYGRVDYLTTHAGHPPGENGTKIGLNVWTRVDKLPLFAIE
ncbi:unnamed protein product [Adineta steineri]|uniref:Prolyl 4-hydroxylase alpha subunit domain-containing protein n=1 Tax=Adineta steineri TaxID=433720 RepID=A0A819BSL6_9BILA|nr:unnamed protein product [Adineta steineri]